MVTSDRIRRAGANRWACTGRRPPSGIDPDRTCPAPASDPGSGAASTSCTGPACSWVSCTRGGGCLWSRFYESVSAEILVIKLLK
jgi:hypothetical protein